MLSRIRDSILKLSKRANIAKALSYFLAHIWPLAHIFPFYPTKVKIDGLTLYLHPRDPGSITIALGMHKPFMTEVFKRVVRKGYIVVDIDAHIGYYSLLAAKLVGEGGKVYAFEPEPRNYELLLKNIKLNDMDKIIIPVRKAVLNENTVIKLYLTKTSQWHSIHKGARYINVEAITLDHFLTLRGDLTVNVVKVDTLGGEPLVFLGMEKILDYNRNIKIFTMFIPQRYERLNISPLGFLNWMSEKGFSIHYIDEDRKLLVPISTSILREFVEVAQEEGICIFISEETDN